MSTHHQFKENLDTTNYGLAVEEIKLVRSIRNLTNLMKNLDSSNKPQHLEKEIACQQRQLQSLKEMRSSR